MKGPNLRTILTIDPSVRHCGYAIWSLQKWKNLVPPLECGVVRADKDIAYYKAGEEICDQLYSRMMHYGLGRRGKGTTRVYCEAPAFRDTLAGHGAAKSGSLIKLSFMFGMIAGLAWQLQAKFIPLEVRDWKGQMPKDVVEKRIRKRMPKWCRRLDRRPPAMGPSGMPIAENCDLRADAIDAVGMGLYTKGFLG